MSTDENEGKGSQPVDLSELENFSFHPKWGKPRLDGAFRDHQRGGNGSGFDSPRGRPCDRPQRGGFGYQRNDGGRKPREFDGQRTDRPGGDRGFGGRHNGNRGFGSRPGGNRGFGGRPGGDRKFGDRPGGDRDFGDRPGENRSFGDRTDQRPRFEPIVSVEFYPNDAVFDAIAAAMKSSSKTYELFKTARLFLEKPERFAMIVRKNEGHSDRNIYLTTDDGFVFETENEAVTHILDNYVERYFDIDDREIPPPAGNFPCLHKCGITGIVLGPPNYHKYQKTSLDHHEKFLSHIPFEKFRAKIEKITDPEEIEKWRLQASKMRIFVPKKNGGAAKIELNSKEEAKKYFVENLRNGAITTYVSVRVSGETFSKMPRTLLSKSLFVLIEREKSFPLGFSNNLRGRLRRGGFAIYKTGGKSGVSYISGIKRKFRIVGDAFAEDIQRIISCIDASPKISMASLRLKCLQKPAGSDPSAGDSSSEAGDSIQSAENFYPSAENSGSVCGGDASESSAETHPPSGKNPTVKSAKSPKIGTENSANQAEDAFLRNLHWLIREGYVAEFEDGTLLATEIMRPQRRAIKSNGGGEGAPANTNYNRLREDKECDRQSEAEVESSGSLEADAESDGSSEAKSDGSSQLTGDADAFDGGEAKLIH